MRISIITATFNSELAIERCLQSVAMQNALEDIEHIIVDGKSTDNTLHLVEKFPHVSTVVSSHDRGIYHAFNKGVALATCELIYFLNSDDEILEADTIQYIIDRFEPAIDFFSGSVLCVNELQTFITKGFNAEEKSFRPHHQGFVCRKEIFEKIGYFNECLNIAADTYFMKNVIRDFNGYSSDRVIAKFSLDGLSSKSANRVKLSNQHAIVDYLLGNKASLTAESESTRKIEENNLHLKFILIATIEKNLDLTWLKEYKVSIFGIRELSLIFHKLLENQGITSDYFIVSNSKDCVQGLSLPCISLEQDNISQPDIIINCIEGVHSEEVKSKIRGRFPKVDIFSWQEICYARH